MSKKTTIEKLFDMVEKYDKESTELELKRLEEEYQSLKSYAALGLERESIDVDNLSPAATVQAAQTLQEEGYITNSDEYVDFLNTGNIPLRNGYEAPVACHHSWKPYMGFTENYDYCEHCGVKEHES